MKEGSRSKTQTILVGMVMFLFINGGDQYGVQSYKITSSKFVEELENNDAEVQHTTISQRNAIPSVKSSEEEEEEVNPSFLFEADINLVEVPEELENLVGEKTSDNVDVVDVDGTNSKRSLRRSQEYLWIDRVIPYEFTPQITESGRANIQTAMDAISQNSCLKFKIKDAGDRDWIRFENKGSCFSSVGRSFWIPGPQTISLTSGCAGSIGTIQHELLHSLGFWHEQSRIDRDNYVEILWENIADGMENQFSKTSRSESTTGQSIYDIGSVMHYQNKAFSKNGKPTIQLVGGSTSNEIGQRRGMSNEDFVQLNRLYHCQDIGEIYTSWSKWSPCNRDDCKKKRQRFCSGYNAVKCPDANSFGVHTETTQCTTAECNAPIDGHWGRWTSWSDCSAQCGSGQQHRQRKCNDPTPSHGGRGCSGIAEQSKACEIMPCGLNPDDCLFDAQGMCFWKEESPRTSGFIWRRISGRTPSGSTGPDNDHTTEKTTKDGYYMFVESSAPAKTGDKASLVSKQFTGSKASCITFFYSMFGSGVGALRVFVKDLTTGNELKVWSKTGDQGQGWLEGEVDISSESNYKVRFEAERGPSFRGDIGIDDVHFRASSCSVVMAPPPLPIKAVIDSQNFASRPTIHSPGKLVPNCAAKFKIEPKGCYHDNAQNKVLTDLLDDHRVGHSGRNVIDWQNFPKTLAELVCHCGERAQAKGYKYFGLQYYGLCYGGNEASYGSYGTADKCIDEKYETKCSGVNTDSLCTGVENMNYIYQLF